MASHWAEYATHKEYTNLQYHTALDDKVRESHAALEGITLPYEDPFWDTAFPPNGWNCRCHVVPVLKEDYPVSDSQTAQQSFEMLTEGSEIFRFNPGKQSAIFPPHHPYYGKQGYKHCLNPHLAHSFDGDPSDPCLVYHKLHDPEELILAKEVKELMEKEKKSLMAATRKAYRENLRKDFYPAKLRKELLLYNGEMKDVRITFRGKGIDHLINDILVGKCPGLSIDDLIYLDEQITEARQMNRSGELYKERKDGIEHFYYLEMNISGVDVEIHLAYEGAGNHDVFFPYSIKKKE